MVRWLWHMIPHYSKHRYFINLICRLILFKITVRFYSICSFQFNDDKAQSNCRRAEPTSDNIDRAPHELSYNLSISYLNFLIFFYEFYFHKFRIFRNNLQFFLEGLGDSWGCKSPNPMENSIRELGGNLLQVRKFIETSLPSRIFRKRAPRSNYFINLSLVLTVNRWLRVRDL